MTSTWAILAVFVTLTSMATAAAISGIVYDESVRPLAGAMVRLEHGGQLEGQLVTNETGAYHFENVATGEHLLTSSAMVNNRTKMNNASLNLTSEDDIRVDFVMLPPLTVTPPELLPGIDEQQFASPQPEAVQPKQDMLVLVATAVIILAAVAILYLRLSKQTVEMKKELGRITERTEKKEEPTMGRYLTDEEKVYQIIQRRKEVPQKDIVTETGFSKAKVSLMLWKLERMSKIKRTTVGRIKLVKFIE